MKLSVIIPCFNAAKTIGPLLLSLQNQQWDHPWEIILADNGSTDNSVEVARQYAKRIQNLRIIDASARRGQTFAMNRGLKLALGKTFVFIDSDDEAAPGWVAAIGNALQIHDSVASRFDITKLNPPWVQKSRGWPQQDGLTQYDPPYLPYAGDCGLGITRKVYETVGEFDEMLPYASDTDYCWRIQQKGFNLVFVHDALLHIRYRETLTGTFWQGWRWSDSNAVLRKKHHLPELTLRDWARRWKNIFRLLPKMRDKGNFAYVLGKFGWRFGEAKAFLKYRDKGHTYELRNNPISAP